MKKQSFFAVALILFLLTGCKSNDTYTEVTVLPTLPILETSAPISSSEIPSDPGAEHAEVDAGSLGYGFGDRESPHIYTGEELRLAFELEETGKHAKNGTGILLFLDGRPQPYKTSEDDTYRYMHVFAPEEGQTRTDFDGELVFMPITGKNGESLELNAINISFPDFSYQKDQNTGFKFTFGAVGDSSIIQFEADAESQNTQALPVRSGLSNVQIFQEDVKLEDIFDWSEMDLEEKIEDHFWVNGMIDTGPENVYGVTSESEIHLRYEVYGTPYVDFGLTLFVENQPLAVDESCMIPISIERGKKTVVEATLTLPDFDGEAPIYAILSPKNSLLNEHFNIAGIDASRTFILIAGEDPSKS